MKIPVIDRLNIGRRLTLCFIVIISLMLAGNGLLLWQFHLLHLEAGRLTSVSQKLIAILRLHTSLLSFDAKLNDLAQSEDVDRLAKETEPLRAALVEESQRARSTLTHLPADIQLEPAFVPTLEAIEITLPSQLEAISGLAKSRDWKAVRLRLANENKPLEAQTSALVTRVEEQVSAEQAQALAKAALVQRRIFLIVSLTGILTLLIAAFLGLAITRSITGPLGRLMEGSRSLAQGDFQHRVVVAGKDELAHLGGVFNDTAEKLSGLYDTLRLREAYLAEAQKLSHTGSFGWNISTDEIHWSDETFRIFGYEPVAKVTPDMILQRTHPEDCLAFRQLIERASNERSEFALEHRLLMPDGSIKYLRVVGHPSTDECCHSEFVGAVTDITDQKRAEESLRESEAYLAEAQKLSHTGSWAWSPDTDVRHWSEECYRVLGFDPLDGLPRMEELIHRIHPDDQPAFRESLKRAGNKKVNVEVDYRIVHPSGAVRDIHSIGHPVFSPCGDLIEFTGTVIDITERKRAEEELQQLVDFVPQLIVVLGPDGKWLHANRVTREYTGLTLEEYRSVDVVGRVIHPDDVEKMRAVRERGLSASDPFEIDARFLGKDGVYRWFLFRYNPLVEQGCVRRWYATATEIEARKQAEERVRRENVRLEERTRIAQELHDTLLQSFLSASMQLGAAMNGLPSESPVKPKLDRILQLMDQGIDEGRNAIQGLRSTDSDISDLVLALSRIQDEIEVQSDIEFRVNVAGRQQPLRPPIRHELYRIGKEALVNAFSHSRAKCVEFALEYADSGLSMRIRDDGCGIDSEILQSGRQGHWGLAGMQERATRMGGLLKISSDTTVGTEVHLFIPSSIAFQR